MIGIGIVGLPNVGKSTLFNAITKTQNAEAANYPFATIEPNIGMVSVPDSRLEELAKIINPQRTLGATVEFIDIAGLVKGASKGEGLGNQFLTNIRNTAAICQVVRCFDDPNIVHVEGSVDPIRDIETINAELIFADLDTVERAMQKNTKLARGGNNEAKTLLTVLEKCKKELEEFRLLKNFEFSEIEEELLKTYQLLTKKPMMFAANVSEEDLAKGTNEYGVSNNGYSDYIRDYLKNKGILKEYNNTFTSNDYRMLDIIRILSYNEKKDNYSLNRLIKESDIITVSLGMSEIYNKILNNNQNIYTYIDSLINDYTKIMNYINKFHHQKVIILGYYNVLGTKDDIFDYANYKLEIECQKRGFIYVDLSKILSNNPNYFSKKDTFVPNLEGYEKISQIIVEKIQNN